jgi:hypothetical protein
MNVLPDKKPSVFFRWLFVYKYNEFRVYKIEKELHSLQLFLEYPEFFIDLTTHPLHFGPYLCVGFQFMMAV